MRQTLLVPEFEDLLAAGDTGTIQTYCLENHPATVAEFLGGLDTKDIWRVLHLLDVGKRAEIFAHFDLDRQVELATGENRREMAGLLEEMEPDGRADLVRRLEPRVAEEILPLVAKAEREDIRKLVSFAEGTAGAVMTTDYATVRPEVEIAHALEQLRHQAPSRETIYYIYVADERHHLVGVVSLKDLILGKPRQTVADVMNREAIAVRVNDDQEHVAREIEKYDFIAIPVVNDEGVLVGIVTHDDALDILRQEQQEDVERFMAIAGRHATGEYLRASPWTHFRNRVGWVVVLAAFGLVSGWIVQRSEALLVQFAVLVAFMPMLAAAGGNTGSQSATLVVRALALREIGPRDLPRVLGKEMCVSLLLAAVLAVLAFGRVLIFGGGAVNPAGVSLARVGSAVALALALQVVTSTLIGALLPMGVARLRMDPALVASPALSTVVDITGLLLYFSVARLVLGF